jgi:SAM-dependent methyltransferase
VRAAFEHWELPLAGASVVDLAAGTGRLTSVLASLGCDVVAVEPVEEMRGLIADAHAVEGTAEAIPLLDHSRDAVFTAEAFHWFDAPVALAEIARVLRPGGGLAVMWNVGLPQEEDQPWRNEVVELVKPIYFHPSGRRVPAAAGNDSREQTEWQRGPGWEHFEPLVYRPFEHVQRMTPDSYLAFVSSWSFVGVLDDEPRAKLLEEVAAVLERHQVGEFHQKWRTDLYVTRRTGR